MITTVKKLDDYTLEVTDVEPIPAPNVVNHELKALRAKLNELQAEIDNYVEARKRDIDQQKTQITDEQARLNNYVVSRNVEIDYLKNIIAQAKELKIKERDIKPEDVKPIN
jgi:hypothetical protein